MNFHNPVPASLLVVDSDPLNLTAMAAVLNTTGNDCYCAQGGEAALKAVRGMDLDLVVLDLDFSAQDEGLELAAELTAEPNVEAVPFILVGGEGLNSEQTEALIQRVHQVGGTYFLQKPFDPDVMLEMVERALWMPHLIRQHATTPPASRPSTPAPLRGLHPRPHKRHARDASRR